MRGLSDMRPPPMGIIDMDSTPPASPASMPPTAIRSPTMAAACSPDEQKRLMVMAGTSSGSPARCPTRRATFNPCSPSGLALPSTRSSILSPVISARASASFTTRAPRSSGRVWRRFPLMARPIGLRTADKITTSRMVVLSLMLSVAKGFPGGQRVLDARTRLLLATQREEGLPLEVEQVLLADRRAGGYVAAGQDVRRLA